MTRERRELLVAVALSAVGAGLALGAASRPWLRELVVGVTTRFPVGETGSAFAPDVPAVALAVLVAPVVLLATRRIGRVVTGAVLVLAGLWLAWSAASIPLSPPVVGGDAVRQIVGSAGQNVSLHVTFWPWIAALGGLCAVAAGVLALARGRSWPGMAARYDRPRARATTPQGAAQLWDALDGGDRPRAYAIYHRMLPLLNVEHMYGAAIYKEVLFRRGVIRTTRMRGGTGPLDAIDQRELNGILADLAALFRVSPPESGPANLLCRRVSCCA